MVNLITGFAGGGGIECGAIAAGLNPALSIEFDPTNHKLSTAIADNHESNFPSTKLLRMTVQDWVRSGFPGCPDTVDIAHFSPVCSNFSLAKTDRGEKQEDIDVATAIAHFIQKVKPRAFTLENVPLYKNSISFAAIQNTLIKMGYFPHSYILNCSDVGVPQSRKRLVLIAIKGRLLPCDFPFPKCNHVGWYDATKGIDLPKSSLTPTQKKVVPKEGIALIERTGYRGKPKVRFANEPCPTIRKYLFLDQHGNSRKKFWDVWDGTQAWQCTIPFMAKLQTFPDWYKFPDQVAVAGSIIGYSVPPLFAQYIFEFVKGFI